MLKFIDKDRAWLFLLAMLFGFLSAWIMQAYSSPQINTPYSIFVEKVTPAMQRACQRDANCMDLGTWADLPSRDLEADRKQAERQERGGE